MKSKSYIFLFVLVFMIVFSLSAVSADDLQTYSGEVSGDVDVATANPYNTSGSLTYDIPSDAKDIKSANVYVNVYSGSASNSYGANANVSLKTDNGENQIASEELWIENGTGDGTVYPVNDHIDKCYSDYQMRYDITNSLKGLNGSSIVIKVDTFKMDNKSFDGRIKLIALVLAYNDGDNDIINYWVDSTQRWTKGNVTTTFDTTGLKSVISADLTNIALSSKDGNYTLNGEFLGTPDNHTSGSTYQYSNWNVADKMNAGSKTELLSTNVGYSLKNVLTVLKVQPAAEVTFNTEYTSVPTCYAGTNNILTVKVKANKAGNYTVQLLADGAHVNSTVVKLDGKTESTVLINDPTIRAIDETTVNGADNVKVNYTVNVALDGDEVASAEKIVPVLYNGNLGYDMEYNVTGFEEFYAVATGGLVIDVKDVSTYLSASAMNRTDVWTIDLEDAQLVNAVLIIPYNWFNANKYNETADMFNVTFNGVSISPNLFYRDQGNLGNYGKYGYGVLIYRVIDLLNLSGDNTLVLNKNYPTPAVYPSALAYWYNAPGSLKYIMFNLGADLLSNSNNVAGRIVKSDTDMDWGNSTFVDASLYVLAASAQAGEGNIIFNGKEFVNVWNGTSSTTDLFKANVTDVFAEFNNVSFVATGSTILALPQFMVIDTGLVATVDSIKTEYTSVPSAYAGTNNTLKVTVSTDLNGNYTICLHADGVEVDEVNATLTNGTYEFLLTDPTIRPIDETTVNGANNTKVNYTVYVYANDYLLDKSEITVPVLYNGYLGYDEEYNVTGFEQFNYVIDGDVVIDVKDDSTYLGSKDMNRTDVWTVNIPDDSYLKEAVVFIPYNWFNAKSYNETEDMFNVTFNGVSVAPRCFYRDQGNLGKYGNYGYGLLVYKVGDLLNVSGDNTLVLNKNYPTPAVYPSTLVYLYNTPGGNFKDVIFAVGMDLLVNDYNNAGRTVVSDSYAEMIGNEFVNATLYVLAASAQAGEGNIIFNGEEFLNVWNGTSNSVELVSFDITGNITEFNNISFVATGSTIVALPQIIVADTGMHFTITSIKPEYTSVPSAYAATNNTLTVTAISSFDGNFTAELYADDILVSEVNVTLTKGTNTFLITDPTIRPADETTVNGANNTEVTYTVEIYDESNYDYSEYVTLPVLYNGYLGYDKEYNATGFEIFHYVIGGDVVIDVKDDSTYLGAKNMNRTDVWTVNIPNNSYLADAMVFIPYNWFNSNSYNETEGMFNVTFNGKTVNPELFYRDQGNLGKYGNYGYGVLVYNVTDLLNVSGDNTLVLNKNYPTPAVYPSVLVYLYEIPEGNFKEVIIASGMDLLSNDYNNAGRTVVSDSCIEMWGADFVNATLYVLAASAQAGEGNIIFNGGEFVNVWNGTSNSVGLASFDITGNITQFNNISFVATGSTIVALPQIIVADSGINFYITSIKPEYTSVPSAYAATNNTLTVTAISSFDGNFTAYLYADDVLVSEVNVTLTKGTNTFLITDPTIRPADETTVNGANNTEVNYTVYIDDVNYYYYYDVALPVLYNGNLGKDLEYNTTYIEDISVFEVTGGIGYLTQNDTTYMSTSSTNRTDVFSVKLDDECSFANAFVYIAYNWDKSGVNGPVLNVTFNGNVIAPKAHYRDQGNLGKYGQYGYGLFVYDVSDLIGVGNNTLVINKEKGMAAVYPSTLVYLYDDPYGDFLYTIYFADGADLLANSNNVAGRTVKTDSKFIVDAEDALESSLVVFAASAQKGEGNVIVNGVEFGDVWDGSSNSVGAFFAEGAAHNVTNVSFVATGSTILALNQIFSVSHKITKTGFDDVTVDGNGTVTAALLDIKGNPLAGKTIKYSINGVNGTTTTNDKGEFSILAGSNAVVNMLYEGDYLIAGVHSTITLKDLAPAREATVIKSSDYETYAIDFDAGERGNYFKVQLFDANGNPLVNKTVFIGFNGKVYNKTTNESGWAQLQINLKQEGKYTFATAFLGDDEYNGTFTVNLITVKLKKTSISASAKSYKASAKTKSYTVTLKTDKGSSIDGKTYLKAGKKVTIKVNGKTYSAKTNDKGQATFKLSITKKGKFSATVKFAGDKTYASSSAKTTITIK